MTTALFDIEEDGQDHGYAAEAGATVRLRLRPPVEMGGTVEFQIFSPDTFNPAQTIEVNPPRASKDAPVLTLVGATEGQAVSPVTLDGDVTIEIPAEDVEGHSWIIRCIRNGGTSTLSNGVSVRDPRLIHERGLYVPTTSGARKIVITERTQFGIDGWAGTLADQVGAEADLDTDPLVVQSINGQPGGGEAFTISAYSTVGFDLRQIDEAGFIRIGFNTESGETYFSANFEELALIVRSQLAMSALYNVAGVRIGFFGAEAVARPSITGATTQQQVDSLVAAFAALGLVTDGR